MSQEEANRLYWEQIRQGDRESLFALHHNSYFHLLRFGLKTCGDHELVKDCVNQLFLQLWEKRTGLSPVTNVRAYLFTALRRLILDQLAVDARTDAAVRKMAEEHEWSELSYEEMMIRVQRDEELKQRLHHAMRQLTPRQIELVRLKFFEGLSYEQIALQTSQTIKTAYNTIYDAIKVLRSILK
ncbi:RNA polymerase sigma factor [Chitinophaga nivalis]|uniref:Sigma-70 family RNA polymerase sigma factor n=1 Tax=Chitinophaga nivalis TaxID=2991709 RepID=A0ABT3IGY1_9BACT|nr:sigma-70 family RNA polymerase sigma factor [Chitinophaga nivalis]MCW3467103.1 sigma-70 family RNA polymerase sigma factor [Chitinophaga nivalis]MCW3483206.1 sigma-70 family RNA polymerase sigma factor [Chitinophaga nivalis]